MLCSVGNSVVIIRLTDTDGRSSWKPVYGRWIRPPTAIWSPHYTSKSGDDPPYWCTSVLTKPNVAFLRGINGRSPLRGLLSQTEDWVSRSTPGRCTIFQPNKANGALYVFPLPTDSRRYSDRRSARRMTTSGSRFNPRFSWLQWSSIATTQPHGPGQTFTECVHVMTRGKQVMSSKT